MKATYSTIVLDLSHARASNTRGTTGPAAQVDSSATSHQDRDDRRRHISSPSEPQEGHRGLSLTASLLTVVCAVGDLVVEGVFLGSLVAANHGHKRRKPTSLEQEWHSSRAASAIAQVRKKMLFRTSSTIMMMG